jgi:predicted TPR repeat methyltransferase
MTASPTSATDPLKAVYAAEAPETVAAAYDAWAEHYDADMAKVGYRHPAIATALLARHVPKGAGPLLDAGAGTGLIGEWLAILGFPTADALDLSEGMLAVTARKKVYRRLIRAALGSPLPFETDAYAAVISTGVFTSGHVGAEGLDELIRITRPGGMIVLTVKMAVWDAGFALRLGELEGAGLIAMVDGTEPYVSMPGEPNTSPSRAIVFRVM